MLSFEEGHKFIGFGRRIMCSHCNNGVLERVYMAYDNIGVLGIPLTKSRGEVAVICSICNTQYDENIAEVMNISKELNLRFYTSLSFPMKLALTRDLNKLGLTGLARYLQDNG